MEVGGFRGSGLMYLLIRSRIYVANSCGSGLRLREGLVLFMEYLSHNQYSLSSVMEVW